MNRLQSIFYLLFFLVTMQILAQVAPDCNNAVPICNNTPVNGGTAGLGTDDFGGSATSGCLEQALSGSIESNSAWYRFRTGASGQLGFNIGIDTSEDWDYALYKTNDCNALGDPIRCNFFDNQDGNAFIGVGEDPTGTPVNVQYEDWIDVLPGEDYYLLINNFSNNNSGFSIQFSGNIFVTNPYDALDCSIINNLLGPPISACENDTVILDATTSGASPYNWFMDTGSGYTQLMGEHDPTLQVTTSAFYRVEVVRPSGNIISEVQVAFSALPVANTITDDASCTGLLTYDLSQKDTEVLGSQHPDEFVVNYYGSQADAVNGTNVLPKQYSTPTGSQTIFVRVGSVDNPKCYDVSQSFQLINLETPVLDFSSEAYVCESSTGVTIGEEMPNADYTYQWDSGETTPNRIVSLAGNYTLTVTNSQSGLSCSDSKTISVIASRPPQIRDIKIEDLQNNNTVTVLTDTTGDFEYRLDDGPFQTGNKFYQVVPGMHTVTVNDPKGCGAVTEEIVVIGFPKFFTPNGDGSNDSWHISGIELLDTPLISIYNRFGKLMVQLRPENKGWNGSFKGMVLPESDYWFRLTYTDSDGQTVTAKYINNHFSLKR